MTRNLIREEELERLRTRYSGRGKAGKGRLLDEFCEQYGYERKHAIKLLRGWFGPPQGQERPGPEPRYEPIREVVETIWAKAEQLCGKRLEPALALWLPFYPRHFGQLLPSQKRLLNEVSAATLDRLLAPRKSKARHGLSGTRPGTLLRTQIPLQTQSWEANRPGYLEADTVAHCGQSLAGDFIWSVVYTDLASGWTQGRAVWNKGAAGVLAATQDVEKSLPFALLGFDCDNGGEFLNWHLVKYLQERGQPVQVTRSRPYHCDDNAHIEQKNWMWPRQLLGYSRLENPDLVRPINRLYVEDWGRLQNFFLPSTKLVQKERVGSRWVKKHDRPQTAYQRLMASQCLAWKAARNLREQLAELDPFVLANEVEKQLRGILGGS